MNKSIFTLIFAVIISSIVFPASAALPSELKTSTALSEKSQTSIADNDGKKKRKLKKKVRQVGRVYKSIKTDKQDKKKARKVQKKIRRVINIW